MVLAGNHVHDIVINNLRTLEIVFIMIAMSDVIPAQHEQRSLDSAVSFIERSVGGSCERLSILQLDKKTLRRHVGAKTTEMYPVITPPWV